MPKKNPSIKDEERYEALREKGMSKGEGRPHRQFA